MSQVAFSVKLFEPKTSEIDSFETRLGSEHWGRFVRARIGFASAVEIIDPNNIECNEWKLGYHQTVKKTTQSDFYSDNQGKETYEHLVDTIHTPACDKTDITKYGWAGWCLNDPVQFSASNKVITVKGWDEPTCGGRYVTRNKKAKFLRTAYKAEFCTWLVALRAIPTPGKVEVRWLNWVRWDLDLTCQIDPIRFTYTPAKNAGLKIIASGGQGTAPPVIPVIDHIWKDNDVWYSLSPHGARKLLDKEP
jgi:hypothetical protein